VNDTFKLALLLTAACLLLTGTAYARQFVGVPSSSLISEGSVTRFVGLQFGTYDLGSGFGLRAGAEVVPTLEEGLLAQGGTDLLYTTGERVVFYLGAGGGYSSVAGDDSLYVAGTVGLDFDAASTLSYFVEAQPRYDLGRDAGLFYLRSGLNLHFGD